MRATRVAAIAALIATTGLALHVRDATAQSQTDARSNTWNLRLHERCEAARRPEMRRIAVWFLVMATVAGGLVGFTIPGSGDADEQAAPIFGIKIPQGYRDWRLISVAREEGTLDDIRANLGNDVAIKAYRDGKLPFPDGTIVARLAWSLVPSEENNKAFGRQQSFVAGPPKNGVQFMIKDSRRYASTGGWGFAQFNDGKPADEAAHKTCFPCHEAIKARDFVFTQYAR